MIKPWKDRVEEAAHFREEDYINDVQYFMQAEIDELRTENAAVMRNNNELLDQRFGLMEQVGTLNAENARLRSALYKIRQEPSNTMSDSKALKEIIRIARAALGES